MEKTEQCLKYAVLIQGALAQMFDKESESDYKLDVDELINDEGKLTDFMHALANIVPCNIYGKFTGDNVNTIDFNHIANKLCFQYATRVEE